MISCQFCKNFEPADEPNYYTMPPDYRVHATGVEHQPEQQESPKVEFLHEDGFAMVTYKDNSIIISWPLKEEGYLERLLEWITLI